MSPDSNGALSLSDAARNCAPRTSALIWAPATRCGSPRQKNLRKTTCIILTRTRSWFGIPR
eukprot:scaffold92266_cov31-Tisochrysis_lutea.AAC.4